MDTLKKVSNSIKKGSFTQNGDKNGKKQKSGKKRKVKRKPEKDAAKVSSSPDGEATDQPSDNPDLESDSASVKDLVLDRSRVNTGEATTKTAPSVIPAKETSQSKSCNPVTKVQRNSYGKPTNSLKSQSATKIKAQSSQSTRIKESSSNLSLSSKSTKSTSSIGIDISRTAVTQSDSRLQLEASLSVKKESVKNESLRWENVCSDSDEEQERLKLYKLNRRKRYLAAANKKYSDWIATLSGSTHSLSTSSNHHMEGDYSSSADSMIRHSNPGMTSNYMKTLNTMQEGFVPGLRPDIAVRSSGSQMMLNC